jgi:hypothetical protein
MSSETLKVVFSVPRYCLNDIDIKSKDRKNYDIKSSIKIFEKDEKNLYRKIYKYDNDCFVNFRKNIETINAEAEAERIKNIIKAQENMQKCSGILASGKRCGSTFNAKCDSRIKINHECSSELEEIPLTNKTKPRLAFDYEETFYFFCATHLRMLKNFTEKK